ncbi:MAG: hypothetical protein AB8B48_10180 [Pseudomonadales bacterium]
MKNLRARIGFIFLLFSFAYGSLAEQSPLPAENKLADSFQNLIKTLQQAERDIRLSPSFGTEHEQVGGYRHLLRSFAKGMEAEVLQDADFPYFRILDFWLKEGGDNPDQRYAFSPIRGGETYRVWGALGSAVRLELQIYAGRPWDGSGKSVAYLNFEDIEFDEQGRFEVLVSAEKNDGSWMPNPSNATTLFARHIYDNWNNEVTGHIHIDRVGFEGKRKPPETANELADRIEAATTMFSTTARTWPSFVNRRYIDAREANAVAPPYDTYALGGAKGRWMSGGHFALADNQVLLLRMPKTNAHYQAIQLTDMWFASLEHANQISSLTTRQSVQADDGAYYYVISQNDPGYPNWLDSGVLARGLFLIRWDGVSGQLSDQQYPSATVLNIADLEKNIPGFMAVSETQREQVREQRRRHLQLRSHR